MVSALLSAKADAATYRGSKILVDAVHHRDATFVRLLLRSKADANLNEFRQGGRRGERGGVGRLSPVDGVVDVGGGGSTDNQQQQQQQQQQLVVYERAASWRSFYAVDPPLLYALDLLSAGGGARCATFPSACIQALASHASTNTNVRGSNHGWTPLLLCTAYGLRSTMKQLLNNGAVPTRAPWRDGSYVLVHRGGGGDVPLTCCRTDCCCCWRWTRLSLSGGVLYAVSST